MELTDLRQRVEEASGYLRISDLRIRRTELEEEAGKPDLWDDINTARSVTKELAVITDDINSYDSLTAVLEEAETLSELAEDEEDETSRRDLEQELAEAVATLTDELDHLELRSLLSGEYDERDAVCQIQSGEGGTDAQDWAEMLLRMYTRWAERRGFETEIVSVREGQEAGIASAEFRGRGRCSYGHLQSEHGIHRLVRISPFMSAPSRKSSSARIDAKPRTVRRSRSSMGGGGMQGSRARHHAPLPPMESRARLPDAGLDQGARVGGCGANYRDILGGCRLLRCAVRHSFLQGDANVIDGGSKRLDRPALGEPHGLAVEAPAVTRRFRAPRRARPAPRRFR